MVPGCVEPAVLDLEASREAAESEIRKKNIVRDMAKIHLAELNLAASGLDPLVILKKVRDELDKKSAEDLEEPL